mgnify:CR=1 FL=1
MEEHNRHYLEIVQKIEEMNQEMEKRTILMINEKMEGLKV